MIILQYPSEMQLRWPSHQMAMGCHSHHRQWGALPTNRKGLPFPPMLMARSSHQSQWTVLSTSGSGMPYTPMAMGCHIYPWQCGVFPTNIQYILIIVQESSYHILILSSRSPHNILMVSSWYAHNTPYGILRIFLTNSMPNKWQWGALPTDGNKLPSSPNGKSNALPTNCNRVSFPTICIYTISVECPNNILVIKSEYPHSIFTISLQLSF